MEARQIEEILIEGLAHTPGTRSDFYLAKADEHKCNPETFCLSLYKAYERLEKYVNTNNYMAWGIDEETGGKVFTKNAINLHHVTNGKIRGTLDNENIIELLPGLMEMTKQLIPKNEAGKQVKTGFKSSLTDGQIQSLYDSLLKGNYIDKNNNPDHFKASLKSDPLPYGFKPIKWQVGKNALRELLLFISGYKNKSDIINLPDDAVKRIIPELFTDNLGKGIALNKPKKEEYSNHYMKIEAIVKGL